MQESIINHPMQSVRREQDDAKWLLDHFLEQRRRDENAVMRELLGVDEVLEPRSCR